MLICLWHDMIDVCWYHILINNNTIPQRYNREIIIKLVKQGNQVVNFLKDLEIQEVEVENAFELPSIDKEKNKNKFKELKELIEEFMDKRKDLEELEEELKKHKDDIVPGKIGEA